MRSSTNVNSKQIYQTCPRSLGSWLGHWVGCHKSVEIGFPERMHLELGRLKRLKVLDRPDILDAGRGSYYSIAGPRCSGSNLELTWEPRALTPLEFQWLPIGFRLGDVRRRPSDLSSLKASPAKWLEDVEPPPPPIAVHPWCQEAGSSLGLSNNVVLLRLPFWPEIRNLGDESRKDMGRQEGVAWRYEIGSLQMQFQQNDW